MPNLLPRSLRPKREKVFGDGPAIPRDRNAKVRIWHAALAYSARHRQPGQHKGPITRAFLEVLWALLWGFHNAKTGRCFPGYERIAAKAGCNRSTVYEAIHALEAAGILTWVNRIARIEVRELDLFGKLVRRLRTIRTSNAYLFCDPLPCGEGRPSSKSENPTGTGIQELKDKNGVAEGRFFDLENPLHRQLMRLGVALGHI